MAKPYNRRWQSARLTWLARHPMCRMCKAKGKLTPATVVDHIVPHKGDSALFWDTDNWQSLCKHCHDSTKQAQERRPDAGCDVNGWPISPKHHWRGRVDS